jgi:hypothetical protein
LSFTGSPIAATAPLALRTARIWPWLAWALAIIALDQITKQ